MCVQERKNTGALRCQSSLTVTSTCSNHCVERRGSVPGAIRPVLSNLQHCSILGWSGWQSRGQSVTKLRNGSFRRMQSTRRKGGGRKSVRQEMVHGHWLCLQRAQLPFPSPTWQLYVTPSSRGVWCPLLVSVSTACVWCMYIIAGKHPFT